MNNNNNITPFGILLQARARGETGIRYEGLGALDFSSKGAGQCQQAGKNNSWPELTPKKMSKMEKILDETTEWTNPDFPNTENNYKYNRMNFELNISQMKKEFF